MGHSPYYPDDVTDEMISRYFGDDGACCEKCYYYRNGICSKKENELDDMAEGDYEELTEEEKAHYSDVDDDDYCDSFEWQEEDNPFEGEKEYWE